MLKMAWMKHIQVKHFVLLFLAVVLPIILLLRNFVFTTSGGAAQYKPSSDLVVKAHSLNHHYDNKTAFAFGGNGLYTTRGLFKCMSAMESLSKIGGWKGDIYFLIDKTDCINKELMKRFGNSNIHVIKIDSERKGNVKPTAKPQPTAAITNLTTSGSRQSRNLRMSQAPFERSMAIKTHILDYIKNPNIELVLWYDCDVLFVKQDCVSHMLANKPKITPERPIFLSNHSHVGSFAVNNSVSKHALKIWRDGILSLNSFSSVGKEAVTDYKVFNQLFGYNASHKDAKFGLFNPIWKDVFPKSLPGDGTIYENTTQCALHLSSGRCNHLGAESIHNVVKNFHLQAYENHYWCPNSNERSMKKYGIDWPFCWDPPFLFDHFYGTDKPLRSDGN